MNKAQFVEKICKETSLSKSQVEKVLDGSIEVIKSSISEGNDVKLVGFGIFDSIQKKERKGRNPKTGLSLVIPSCKVPRFRPGKDFKRLLNP